MTLSRYGLGVLVALGVLMPASAEAVSFTFSNCINSTNALCPTLASQLKVEVTDNGNYVNFRFTNEVGITSSVSEIYFDASGFLTSPISIVSQDGGVSFTVASATPGNVPGANEAMPPFEVTGVLLAGANPSPEKKGINAVGDQLTVSIAKDGKTFQEIIEALQLGPNSGDGIRIAAHVIGLPDGQSLSLICCTGSTVTTSEPAAMALFGLVALGAAYRLNRRRA